MCTRVHTHTQLYHVLKHNVREIKGTCVHVYLELQLYSTTMYTLHCKLLI